MKRREALEKTGWILKSAIFTPGLVAAIQNCQPKVSEGIELAVLDHLQFHLANAIADTILPKTESPSASEVKVVEFMDLLLKDVFESPTVDTFLAGLQQFNQQCKEVNSTDFVDMTPAERSSYLEPLDREIMEKNYDREAPFYYTFKRLCINIYYTSEQGVKQNLNYQPVPGAYQGDVELKGEDKIMVGNSM